MHIGIDGSKKGWFIYCIKNNGCFEFSNTEKLIEKRTLFEQASCIWIDMPIGLSDNTNFRKCDIEARNLLKRKQSSIFPVPIRKLMNCTTYKEASALNQNVTGKKISWQTFYLIKKIRELDQLLEEHKSLQSIFFEASPELQFYILNKGEYLPNKKRPDGIKQRLKTLQKFDASAENGFYSAFNSTLRKELAADDILDAMCLAISCYKASGNEKLLPAIPEYDTTGKRQQIALWHPKH